MPVRVKVEDPVSIDVDDDAVRENHNNEPTNATKTTTTIDDDDEIVREMDVYLSPALAHTLHLLQFPLQHFAPPSTTTTTTSGTSISSQRLYSQLQQQQQAPVAARMKPQHNLLELDQAIPMDLMEQMGEIALDQRTFASHTVPVTTHLALGKIVMDDDNDDTSTQKCSLHLVPIQHITQMRPTFSHIDALYEEEMAAEAAANDEEEPPQPPLQQQQQQLAATDSKERKPLMFQKKESERAAMARKNSYAYKKASEEAEEWISLTVMNDNDDSDIEDDDDRKDLSVAMLRKQLECPLACRGQLVLDHVGANAGAGAGAGAAQGASAIRLPPATTTFANPTSSSSSNSLLSYVRSLDYLPSAVATYDRAPVSATTAHQSNNNNDDKDSEETSVYLIQWKQSGLKEGVVLDLPTIGAHLTTVLRHKGWPIPFQILKATVPSSVSESQLLTTLTSCAVLVRGNYVLQSRHFVELPKSVAKARTFILLLLQSIGVIQRRRLDHVFGINDNDGVTNDNNTTNILKDEYLTAETILMLLKQVARKTSDGWVLKIEDDTEFLKKFPDNANIYMEYWGRQMLRFQDCLCRYAAAS